MISPIQKLISPLFPSWRGKKESAALEAEEKLPPNVSPAEGFPDGYHVYSFAKGPEGEGQVLVGGGNPATSLGALFLGDGKGAWEKIDLPDETALLSHILRLPDGRYVAGGMNSIGRGAILISDPLARNWKSIELDLHPYSAIASIISLQDGTLLAAAGKMVTQGKTKPVLFRSVDGGVTWAAEDLALPVTAFLSFDLDDDGTIFAGTAGDHTPTMYRSLDGARTWQPLPDFPAHKTYKMLSTKLVDVLGRKRLFILLWGYKIDIADRVVRLYMSSPDFSSWEELPPIFDSHFIFSFLVTKDRMFYAGSEKGRVFRSRDLGRHWEEVTEFSTNIGAYSLHEDDQRRVWIGKDFVPPAKQSLWQVSGT